MNDAPLPAPSGRLAKLRLGSAMRAGAGLLLALLLLLAGANLYGLARVGIAGERHATELAPSGRGALAGAAPCPSVILLNC